MSATALRIGRIRDEIHRLNQTGELAPDLVERTRDAIAECVLRAFLDDDHPLSAKLKALGECVAADEEFQRSKEGRRRAEESRRGCETAARFAAEIGAPAIPLPSDNPNRLFFMPQPGLSDRERRQSWPLQLLLATAARSERYGAKLAEALLLSRSSMLQAVDEAARASTAMWSQRQYAGYLEEALGLIEDDAPSLPYRRDGQDVHHAGGHFRLSQQEMLMLRILEENFEKPVTYTEFRKAGVAHPTQRKKRLVEKFQKAGIDLCIRPSPNAYTLFPTPS